MSKSKSCGNETHIAKTKKSKGGKKTFGNEAHVAKTKRRSGRKGTSACGNEKHVVKRRKMKKNDMGLWGKNENPYKKKRR